MKEVFLSYAREDEEKARSLWQALHHAGIDVWYDKRFLSAGQDWRMEIEQAIRNAKIFLACLSTKSVNKRGFVQSELRKALEVLDEVPEGQVYLMPVRLDNCEVPRSLSHLHYIDAFEEGAIPRLVSSITRHLREGDYVGGISSVLKFALIRINASDLNWAELPVGEEPTLFGEQYEQYFNLVEFVNDADPIFDITLKSVTDAPVILTQVGVQIVHTHHEHYVYGFPRAAKIKAVDSYILEMPNIFRELNESIGETHPSLLERAILLPLPDPIYFEGNAAFRFTLRLKYYTQHVPNHTLLRFIIKTDQGDSYSHLIRTFTW